MNKETKGLLTSIAGFDFEAASNDELFDAATEWAGEAQHLLRRAGGAGDPNVLTVEIEGGLVRSVYATDSIAIVVDFDLEGSVPTDPHEAAEQGYLDVGGSYADAYTVETSQEMPLELRRAVQTVLETGQGTN